MDKLYEECSIEYQKKLFSVFANTKADFVKQNYKEFELILEAQRKGNDIVLSWNPAENLTRYRLQRWDSSTNIWQTIIYPEKHHTKFTDKNVNDALDYKYRLMIMVDSTIQLTSNTVEVNAVKSIG